MCEESKKHIFNKIKMCEEAKKHIFKKKLAERNLEKVEILEHKTKNFV